MGEKPAVFSVTGPGTNIWRSSGMPGVDDEALPSSYENDVIGARRSGQGNVPSRSPSSNSDEAVSGICCTPFSTRLLSTETLCRNEAYPQDSCRPTMGRRYCEPRKLGRSGSSTCARCFNRPRKRASNRLLEPTKQKGRPRLHLKFGAIK